MKTDIVIIGAGVIGSAIARELARYNLQIVLLEKDEDVAMGTSKANSGIIHAGYNADINTLKGKLNVKANPIFDKLCADLNVPFKRIGSLVVGFNKDDLKILKKEKENGEKMGIAGMEIISGEELFKLEQNINREAKYALYAPTAGIISSYEFTIALADNAVTNGVKVFLDTEVIDILTENEQIIGVKTNNGIINTNLVINAAGLFSDNIARMAGDNSIKIKAFKGEYHLLDKKWGDYVKHVLFPIPDKDSKGILVTPTAHNNIILGPNSNNIENKEDLSVSKEGLDEVFQGVRKLLPELSRRDVIAIFAGLRAKTENDDFIIGFSESVKGLINVAGIQSPGLSSAPAIAEMVVDLVRDYAAGDKTIVLKEKEIFKEKLPLNHIFTEESIDKWNDLVKGDSAYGEIICRCEKITKGEIVNAIHRPVPARSLDAIKRRTRAGTGRCQGGFCGPRVLEILSRELGLERTNITKKGKGSEILIAKAKEFLSKDGDNNEG